MIRQYVGLDVGGTNLKAGIVDGEGHILSRCRRPLGTFRGPEQLACDLAALAREAAALAGTDPEQLAHAGIGIPGAVEGGDIRYTCNIPMRDVPFAKLFRQQLNIPVLLGNDADCAAVGEYLCGAGRGNRDLVVLTLGTGIGGGFILGGRLYTGSGMAGEVGHLVTHPDGLICTCGRRGCWESYASATALVRMTREAMAEHPESALWTVSQADGAVDGRTAFAAALEGDSAALALCRAYVEELALGVTDIVNILHPQVVALGGGVADAPEALLLEPLRRLVGESCYPRHGGMVPRIVRAELGNDAGIIGAALLDRAV